MSEFMKILFELILISFTTSALYYVFQPWYAANKENPSFLEGSVFVAMILAVSILSKILTTLLFKKWIGCDRALSQKFKIYKIPNSSNQ